MVDSALLISQYNCVVFPVNSVELVGTTYRCVYALVCVGLTHFSIAEMVGGHYYYVFRGAANEPAKALNPTC